MKQLGPVRERVAVVAGAGAGLLCRALVERGAQRVVAIEPDERWDAQLDAAAHASGGVLTRVSADALSADYEQLLRGLGGAAPAPRPWAELSEALLISALPRNLSRLWWLRMYAHCALRRGAFALGRARVAVLVPRDEANRLIAQPQYDEFCRESLQCHAFFEPRLRLVMNPRSFVGPTHPKLGTELNPPCLVTLDPLADPRTALGPEELHAASSALLPQRRRRRAGASGAGDRMTPQSLWSLLSASLGEAGARRVLDDSGSDSALAPMHLDLAELYRVCAAVAQVHQEAEGGTAAAAAPGLLGCASIEELVTNPPTQSGQWRGEQRAAQRAGDDWDPLFAGWEARAAAAPLW